MYFIFYQILYKKASMSICHYRLFKIHSYIVYDVYIWVKWYPQKPSGANTVVASLFNWKPSYRWGMTKEITAAYTGWKHLSDKLCWRCKHQFVVEGSLADFLHTPNFPIWSDARILTSFPRLQSSISVTFYPGPSNPHLPIIATFWHFHHFFPWLTHC